MEIFAEAKCAGDRSHRPANLASAAHESRASNCAVQFRRKGRAPRTSTKRCLTRPFPPLSKLPPPPPLPPVTGAGSTALLATAARRFVLSGAESLRCLRVNPEPTKRRIRRRRTRRSPAALFGAAPGARDRFLAPCRRREETRPRASAFRARKLKKENPERLSFLRSPGTLQPQPTAAPSIQSAASSGTFKEHAREDPVEVSPARESARCIPAAPVPRRKSTSCLR